MVQNIKSKIIAAVFIACLFATTGCSILTHSSTTTRAQTIIAKTLSAMTQVKSYKLDTDIINTYKVIEGSTTDTTEWEGTKLINVSNQEMEMNMTIPQIYSGANLGASLEMYFKDGYEYLKTYITGLSGANPWIKTKLDDTSWNRETQIPYLIELFKNATQFSSLENEKVNGVDCYVMTITPSVQTIIDFVVSQEQPVGAQLDVMRLPKKSCLPLKKRDSGELLRLNSLSFPLKKGEIG